MTALPPDRTEETNPPEDGRALRRGWTTGTCATAASRAAFQALLGLPVDDPAPVTLPNGSRPAFALACCEGGEDFARAGVIKDAGDDPDVTHGALITATVRRGTPGSGVAFKAGKGVGTVTLPGLPLAVGEPAINPVPRQMIRSAIEEVAASAHVPPDVIVEIGVENGEKLAERTMNGRLGIIGGLSILGTTGIVIPYSCASWIASIHRGIDIARAANLRHIAGSTGATSETAVRKLIGLPEQALIDMGDFVGGMLKYIASHPIDRVTIAGGFAKMTKLAQGRLDLHSKRNSVDFDWLAERFVLAKGDAETAQRIRSANTALEVLQIADACNVPLGEIIASGAAEVAARALNRADIRLDVAVFDRTGKLIAQAAAASASSDRSINIQT